MKARARMWGRAGIWAVVLVGVAVLGRSALERLSVPMALAQLRTPDAGAPAAARPPSSKVRITFQTVPILKNKKVEVRWGKKRLGFIDGARKPFILERARDSGPIDVTIKAEGFITVNTRAYTFDDNKVFVKMTPVEEKHTLLGYRVQLPDGGADGGVPDGGGMPGVVAGQFDARPPPIPPPGAPIPVPTAPVPPPTAPAPAP